MWLLQTRTNGNALPTQAFTTTYTVTSCPPIDQDCETGVVVTETFNAAGRPTVTVTMPPGGGDSGSDEDDAGVRPDAMTALLLVAGLVTMGWNML